MSDLLVRFECLIITTRGFTAVQRFASVLCGLESLDVPTIAVVNGAALGGGLELILCCDYCVADAVHCTQLGVPEVKLGVLPGVSVTVVYRYGMNIVLLY